MNQGQSYGGYQQPYPQQGYQQPVQQQYTQQPQQQYPQQPIPQANTPMDYDDDNDNKKIMWMTIAIVVLAILFIISTSAYFIKTYKDINTVNSLQEEAYKAGYDRAARDMIVTIAAQVDGVGFVQINYPKEDNTMGKLLLRPFAPGEEVPTG